jgi:hypothetical protein
MRRDIAASFEKAVHQLRPVASSGLVIGLEGRTELIDRHPLDHRFRLRSLGAGDSVSHGICGPTVSLEVECRTEFAQLLCTQQVDQYTFQRHVLFPSQFTTAAEQSLQ